MWAMWGAYDWWSHHLWETTTKAKGPLNRPWFFVHCGKDQERVPVLHTAGRMPGACSEGIQRRDAGYVGRRVAVQVRSKRWSEEKQHGCFFAQILRSVENQLL
jgi:very-short-patch-repair endonuclease